MRSTPEFTARLDSQNGVARVALSGELDQATAPILQRRLAQINGDGATTIMLDLRGLTFIDSTGLHVFLQEKVRSEQNGHRVMLVGVSGVAQRLFELTGTQFLLDENDAVDVLDQFTRGQARREGESAVADVGLDG